MSTPQSFDIPPAPVAPSETEPQAAGDLAAPSTYEIQLPLVHEKVLSLSWANPRVSFELSQDLDTRLKELLLARGYNVETFSQTTMVYGHVRTIHRVTISIPNAISGMNRVSLMDTPVFRFPRPYHYFHGLI